MQSHVYEVPTEEGQPHYRFLCSDLHLGSAYVDEKRLFADLDNARLAGARVLINGDLWDAIGPGDKRFTASCLHKHLRGQDDLSGAQVEFAFKRLEPYADMIDVVGIGNHEEAWVKYRLKDMTADLVARLNAHLGKQGTPGKIRHGGVTGWVVTRFGVQYAGGRGPGVLHRLLYQHGAGGDSPVTKGTIDGYRRGNSFEFDCFTFGHKHNSMIVRDAVSYVTPNGHVRQRERLIVQTASYLKNIVRTTQEKPLDYSYAESKQHPPKPLGGTLLCLTPRRHHAKAPNGTSHTSSLWSVEQDVMSRYVPPFIPAGKKLAKSR